MAIDYEQIVASRLVGLYENEIYELVSYIKEDSNVFMKQSNKNIYEFVYNKIQSSDFKIESYIDDLLRAKLFDDHYKYVQFLEHDQRFITTHDAYLHLKESQIRRRIIVLSEKAKKKATNGDDVFNILEATRSELENIGEIKNMQTYKYIQDILTDTGKYIDDKHVKPSRFDGYVTKFRELDNIIGGFQKGHVIYLAARTSAGKTATALKLAYNMASPIMKDNVAKYPGLRVAFYSLEMSSKSLTLRLLSQISKVPINVIKYGKYDVETKEKIDSAIKELSDRKFTIDDASAIDLNHIKTSIFSMPTRNRPQVLFVDYLQLMTAPNASTREREVAMLSAGLKAIAKELDVVIVCLAQLSREVDKRGGPPILSDLRESGAIEQNADVVMFLNRPENNGEDTFKDGTSTKNIIEIIVAKNREGATGSTRMRFVKECTDIIEI